MLGEGRGGVEDMSYLWEWREEQEDGGGESSSLIALSSMALH